MCSQRLRNNMSKRSGSCMLSSTCHFTSFSVGALSAGSGTRFVLANTDKLHAKLLDMSQRIRQLEDALQISHASLSHNPHPLLCEELLQVKSGVDLVTASGDNGSESKSGNSNDIKEEKEDGAGGLDELPKSFGVMSISENGDAFLGRATESLMMVSGEPPMSIFRNSLTDPLLPRPSPHSSSSILTQGKKLFHRRRTTRLGYPTTYTVPPNTSPSAPFLPLPPSSQTPNVYRPPHFRNMITYF